MAVSNYVQSGLPAQQITLKLKLKDKDKFGVSDWMRKCLDGLENIGKIAFFNNLKLKSNYELVRGVFNYGDYINAEDYFDLPSSISQQLNLPSYIRHYDIITKAVNVLVGEFLNRPDIFRVKALDNFSNNEIIEAKSALVVTYATEQVKQRVLKKLLELGLDPERNEFNSEEESQQYAELISQKTQELTPDYIEKYFATDFYTEAEKFGNAVLHLDRERFMLSEMEAKEFEDLLIADRCFRHFYLTSGGYGQERWNPIFTFHHISPQVENVEDGDYVGQFIYLSKAQIIDKFGWLMTTEQKELLYPNYDKQGNVKGDVTLTNLANRGMGGTLLPYADYNDYKLQTSLLGYDPHTGLPSMQGLYPYDTYTYDLNEIIAPGMTLAFNTSEYVQVVQGYWRSQRLIGKLNLENPETGEIEPTLVDETFDPKLFGIEEVEQTFKDSNKPNTIAWTWKTQIWQGIKINLNYNAETELTKNALYIDVRPCPLQLQDPVNPDRNKLPVIGKIFNNMNSKSTSLVDLLKPYQIMYNALMNRAYDMGQREIGKFMIMDVGILNVLKDWGGNESSFEKVTSIAKAFGVVPISTKNGLNGVPESAINTAGKIVDLDVSEQMMTKIQTAIVIEDQAYKQLGITRERMGNVAASQTATGTQQAISNSYSQTESYFQKYYNYKKRCMNTNIEVAQQVASSSDDFGGDITLNYILADTSRAFLKVNDLYLSLRKLGVYVTDSQELQRQLETIKQLAINNNTTNLPMSSLFKMVTMNSPREVLKELEVAEKKANEQLQQIEENKKQIAEMQIQAQAEENEKDRQKDIYIAELKANTDLQKTTLQGIANESSFDPNADLTDKLIAQKDIALKEQDINSKNYLAQQQLINQQLDSFRKEKLEKEKMQSDKKLKQDEAKWKKDLETKKNEGIEIQNRNQEKLQSEKIKADKALQEAKHKAEMALKEKDKQLKELDLQIRKAEIENSKKEMNMELKTMEKKIDLEEDMAQVKADSIRKITEAKAEEARKLAAVKAKQADQEAKLKIKESEQQHEFNLKEAENSHKLKMKVDVAKAKEALKNAKKPKKKE